MKKIALLCLFAALVGGSIFAQPKPPAGTPAAIPTTTIKGTLGLKNGRISVVSENITYYVTGIGRFVGFIDGLKEGAQVSLEGYAAPQKAEGQKDRLFHPVTLTLNGKNYEVGAPFTRSMTPDRNKRPELFGRNDRNDRNDRRPNSKGKGPGSGPQKRRR